MQEATKEKIIKWYSNNSQILLETGFLVEDLDYFVKLNSNKSIQLQDSLMIYSLILSCLKDAEYIKIKLHIPLVYSTKLAADTKFTLKKISAEMDFSPPKFVIENINKTHQNSSYSNTLIKRDISPLILNLPVDEYCLFYVTYPEKNSKEEEWNRFLELSTK
jgi:hypothetical protein